MLRHALILGGLLSGVLGPALSGIAADSKQSSEVTRAATGVPPAAPASKSALAGVPALDKPVSFAEEKIALSELVARVADETGVALTAHKDVADEPITVYVKALPARELLEQLAEMLDYRWSRRVAGTPESGATGGSKVPGSRTYYEVWQDLASKQREEALRQGNLGDAVKRIRAELARYKAVAALSDEQLNALATAAEEQEKARQFAIPRQGDAGKTPAAEEERRARGMAARRLKSPITRSLANLLGNLTPEQWETVAAKGALTFSSAPAFNEDQLPVDLEHACRSSRPTLLRPASPDPDAPTLDAESMELLHRQEALNQERWKAATGFRAQVRLQVGSGIGGSVTVSATVLPLRSGAQGKDALFFSNETDLTIVALPQSRWNVSGESMEKERELAESDAVLGKRLSFTSGAKPLAEPFGFSGISRWRLFDLMPDLARVYGVQFIADAYSSSMFALMAPTLDLAPSTLYAQLTRYGGGRRIERKGDLVRLRSRTWFLDRRQEIPLRLVRHWQALCREAGALPFDEYLSMATTLTDDQVKSVARLIGEAGLPRDLLQLASARPVLRLIASLPRTQQQTLWNGAPVPVSALTEPQRRLFLAALQQLDHESQRALNLSRWMGGSLSLTLGERTERPLPSGKVGVPNGTAPPEAGARCSVVPVRLHLQYAPDATETLTLTVSP